MISAGSGGYGIPEAHVDLKVAWGTGIAEPNREFDALAGVILGLTDFRDADALVIELQAIRFDRRADDLAEDLHQSLI